MSINLPQQIAAAQRELKMRIDVYPRWVSKGKLRQAEADYQIEAMRAIIATLESIQAGWDPLAGDAAATMYAVRSRRDGSCLEAADASCDHLIAKLKDHPWIASGAAYLDPLYSRSGGKP